MISMTVFFNTGGCGRPWACLWYSWLVISPKTDWVVSKTVHEQNRYFWIFNEYRILAYPNHIQNHIFCYIFEEHTLGMSEVFVDSDNSQNWWSTVQNCTAQLFDLALFWATFTWPSSRCLCAAEVGSIDSLQNFTVGKSDGRESVFVYVASASYTQFPQVAVHSTEYRC